MTHHKRPYLTRPSKKNIWSALIALFWVVCCFPGCQQPVVRETAEFRLSKQVVQEWNRLLLELERKTPGYRVPVTARMFAYVGSTAWQAALPAFKGYCSLDNFCPQFRKPLKTPDRFYLPASLNAAYAEILRQFFPTAPTYLAEQINALELRQAQYFKSIADQEIIRQSGIYGKKSALAVWRWSVTDTLGNEGFLYNYDRHYAPPDCEACWRPDKEHPKPALLPFWGRVRPFVVDKAEVSVTDPLPADGRPGSAYYAAALEVFALSQPMSEENRRIAEFWSDDVPGLNFTPAGHWISIAMQAVECHELPLMQELEMYLKLGFAMSDAIITCWDAKYSFNRERPEAIIRRAIAPNWKPLHDAPAFPSYPSGHAVLGGAAAEILTAYFGPDCHLTDRTYEKQPALNGVTRSFRSFAEMAQENASSRIALGVHFRMDCEEGMRIGRLIGRKVAALPLDAPKTNLSVN